MMTFKAHCQLSEAKIVNVMNSSAVATTTDKNL